ncbi:GMP synthase [Tirmania nivea]|nr:GMP synthase [Tirmania nivea]
MGPSLRIAILLCGSPMPLTAEKYGTYGGVFKALLEKSAESLKGEIPGIENGLEMTSWDVYQAEEYPRLEDIDAILMTGSSFTAYHDLPWIKKLVDFIKTVLAQDRVRIIGICFGHQILGRALGLPVCRNEGAWEISVTPMSLTPTGKRLFEASLKPSMLSLMQMHQDIVKVEEPELPDGIENLGSTDVCRLQGMYKKGKFISVQGHPEYTPDIVKEMVHVRTEMGIFNKEMHDDAMNRLWNAHDGVAAGSAFLRFLME